MIDAVGFYDMRNYIKRRLSYARYRIGTTFYIAQISDIGILPNGTVRAQIVIGTDTTPVTINRVELYNSDSQLWAHQDCSITISDYQSNIMYWFDFTVEEVS